MPQLRIYLLLPLAAALAAACQTAPPPRGAAPGAAVVIEPQEDWRATALPEHASITEDMPPLFAGLAASARPGAADRDLLDADLLLRAPAPAPGAYRCRLLRLPAPATAARRERGAAARQGFCFVGAEGERLSLTVETPARRLGGYLWPSTDARRMVFLGAAFSPPARTAPAYSAAPGGNTAGLFERTGDFRYRLTVRGASPGTVDVYELVAAPAQR